MKVTKKFYIQAEKFSFNSEFTIAVNSYKNKSNATAVVIDIDETHVEFDVPELTQEQFTNGHIEQLRELKQKLKADTQIKMQSLNDQIESLLAIESK